jgi:hypothetical protein
MVAGAALGAGAPTPTASLPAAASASTSVPDERAQAHAEFRRLFDAGDYAAAVVQGQKVVELAGQLDAGQGEASQVALMNLALAQQRAGDYVAAEATYQRVIDLIEAAGRTTNPRLARPMAASGSPTTRPGASTSPPRAWGARSR